MKRILSILVLVILLLGCSSGTVLKVDKSKFEQVDVKWIVDGDTFKTKNGEKVRIIGINTPERGKNKEEVYGREAENFAIETLKNKKVYLEKDISDRDKYGRLLRHVWLEIPDKIDRKNLEKYCYGAIALKEGYAQVYTFAPDIKYESEYLDISREARSNKMGLWSKNIKGTTRGSSLD